MPIKDQFEILISVVALATGLVSLIRLLMMNGIADKVDRVVRMQSELITILLTSGGDVQSPIVQDQIQRLHERLQDLPLGRGMDQGAK